jgi:hypothetical protein
MYIKCYAQMDYWREIITVPFKETNGLLNRGGYRGSKRGGGVAIY